MSTPLTPPPKSRNLELDPVEALAAEAMRLLAERDSLAAEVQRLRAACESARIALANPGSVTWRETALVDLVAALKEQAP